MPSNYGAFPKILAIGSGILLLWVSSWMVAGNAVGGLTLTTLGFLAWGYFVKVLVFVYEPEDLVIYEDDPDLEKINREVISILENRSQVKDSRIITAAGWDGKDTRQSNKNNYAEEKEWAEMMRVL